MKRRVRPKIISKENEDQNLFSPILNNRRVNEEKEEKQQQQQQQQQCLFRFDKNVTFRCLEKNAMLMNGEPSILLPIFLLHKI